MTTLTISCAYTAQYPDPIRFRAGETLTLSGKVDTWDDHAEWIWLWATAPDGRKGWVPAEVVDVPDPRDPGARTARARRDYDARELTVVVGERVERLETVGGWHLCRAADGRVGWVPVSHV